MSSTAEIRAVSFDVGGTLIEPWPSIGHVYAGVAERFGIHGIDPGALNRQFAAAWKARADFNYSREAWRELVNQSFAGLWPEAPGRECFDAMYDVFGTATPWRIMDDVRPTLDAVRARGWKLAIVSNWDERLRPLLGKLDLLECFDAIVISCEAGCTKPVPDIFRQAAVRLGLPPGAILHVGDSAEEDFIGARSAGMKSMLLNRKQSMGKPDVVSTLTAVFGAA